MLELEQSKDPKCYATASRLEDFMYGTPLTDEARNFKIELQKEIVFYLRKTAAEELNGLQKQNINLETLGPIIASISDYQQNASGDFIYKLTSGQVLIKAKDYNQYKSVSFGYRSLLSVEQDLAFLESSRLPSFDLEALELANSFVNLMTLVVLKVADLNARKQGERQIDLQLLKTSWTTVLKESKHSGLQQTTAPYPVANQSQTFTDMSLLRKVIDQKLLAYKAYNNLAENVFLRNVQVYYAKQKLPTDLETSDALRSYYLESMIQFTAGLIVESNKIARSNQRAMIRPAHVNQAGRLFLPANTNAFEDVLFFPNSKDAISIESYDMDSFRDSGFHWRILGYALDEINDLSVRSIDPNAAEILVEYIAQMGVLVLRLAGIHSKERGRIALQVEDIYSGFSQVQAILNRYDFNTSTSGIQKISSSVNPSLDNNVGFASAAADYGIDFMHKSADWLNRHIRSYTVNDKEGVIKIAIPPAFGGSGVAAEDINNDGLIDLLLLGGFGNKLYQNTGDGFVDITIEAGLYSWNDSIKSYEEPRQPIIVDFNNDGHQDLFISYVNKEHQLYKNLGNGQFLDVTKDSRLGGKGLVGGPATALDFDQDGLLDLFIGYFGNYVEGVLPTLSRDNTNGSPNKLLRNMGDFRFEEVKFTHDSESNRGWTQAIGHSDINQDGLQDLIVGNDFGRNKYYLAQKDGTFKESSSALGTDKPSYTMNVGIADLNKDLYPDFYISNIVVMQKDEKYVSPNSETTMKFDPEKMANIRTVEANDLFLSRVDQNTLKGFTLSNQVGRGYSATGWSWDADFFDYDNDGDQDLYCLNGMNDFSVYSTENPFYFERKESSKSIEYAQSNREQNVFFVNENGALLNRAEELGANLLSNARSAAYADLDQDGDLDIVINNYHEQAQVLENRLDNTHNWIKIRLVGSPEDNINKDAIGSTLVLNSANNENLWREIHSTTGYLSVHPKEQHVGLGNDQKVDVEIQWSNGKVFRVDNLEAQTRYQISYPNDILVMD